MEDSTKKKWKLRIPDTPAFFMIMIVLIALLTLIIPAGAFDRMVDPDTGRTLVVEGTYKEIDVPNITIGQILTSLFRGLYGGADIAAFIFVVGGAFGIISSTGAITSGLNGLIKRFSNKEWILITIMISAFALCGGTFGMGEEALPFVAVIVAATVKMGMGPITGLGIVLVGIYSGYTAGPTNPFNTGIAQGIAELPTFSGIGLRILLMVGAVVIAAHHTICWGNNYKKIHTLDDENVCAVVEGEDMEPLTGRQKLVLIVLAVSIIIMMVGVLGYGWYFEEMTGLFMGMGLVAGLVYYRSLEKTGNAFVAGACDMTIAVMYFAFARAILVIMEDGQIMDTVVYALSVPLSQVSGVFAAWGIFLSQGIINFFIPSSSGQAAAVMPILTPLSDLIGVTRQTTVMAYQCGDGFWNMITPTHMIVCAACGIAGVKFTEWFKYAWKLVIKWCIWTFIVLAIAVLTNYGPY